jgi:hypothetical protein
VQGKFTLSPPLPIPLSPFSKNYFAGLGDIESTVSPGTNLCLPVDLFHFISICLNFKLSNYIDGPNKNDDYDNDSFTESSGSIDTDNSEFGTNSVVSDNIVQK